MELPLQMLLDAKKRCDSSVYADIIEIKRKEKINVFGPKYFIPN